MENILDDFRSGILQHIVGIVAEIQDLGPLRAAQIVSRIRSNVAVESPIVWNNMPGENNEPEFIVPRALEPKIDALQEYIAGFEYPEIDALREYFAGFEYPEGDVEEKVEEKEEFVSNRIQEAEDVLNGLAIAAAAAAAAPAAPAAPGGNGMNMEGGSRKRRKTRRRVRRFRKSTARRRAVKK